MPLREAVDAETPDNGRSGRLDFLPPDEAGPSSEEMAMHCVYIGSDDCSVYGPYADEAAAKLDIERIQSFEDLDEDSQVDVIVLEMKAPSPEQSMPGLRYLLDLAVKQLFASYDMDADDGLEEGEARAFMGREVSEAVTRFFAEGNR